MQILTLVFFGAVGIQVVFLITFLAAFSRKREKRNFSPPISVVICGHDEEENLRKLIPLLLLQDYPDFEIIIVDDRSNDGTYDLLLEETKKEPRLRMVHVNRLPDHANGKKYAITLGVKAARHEWILFSDADCRPKSKHWIKAMASACSDQTTFILGYSPYLLNPGFLNTFIRFESLMTAIQYIGFALLKNPYMGVGRNLAYRKSFFLKNKGFNNLLSVTGGDDDLFVNQHATSKNTAVAVGTNSLVYSVPKKTWKSFLQQKVRHLAVGKRYKFKHRFLLGLFSLSWLTTWFVGLWLVLVPVSTSPALIYIGSALIARTIMLMITTQVAVRYLGQKFEAWPVLFLDFLYSIYYISTGVVALFTKKVQWRN